MMIETSHTPLASWTVFGSNRSLCLLIQIHVENNHEQLRAQIHVQYEYINPMYMNIIQPTLYVHVHCI